ncbi:bile acid:sodium symporter family protein [Solimonas sp. K1W22B-7]|uniref:bile acid:sodium symporter family protein n=1 Tax=Solimonas sp. K1W22B-7 TaxID=2303331 RepID=UPI000E3375F2|nr:bile acid:sodium symporter family protein [Solimonas sp. K1W22B-7]AXQ30911.1 bile acid:sodium symporter family protein [Solimonas sp. K1W22B-7]
MTADPITTMFLPIALGIIMFGLGLSLRVDDFTRVLRYPRAVLVALACQMLILPAAGVGIAHLFGLPPVLAVGLMLLAASPGGTSANLYSHLSHGDVALNITLTAVNSVLAMITIPIIVNLSMLHFMEQGQSLPLQYQKVIELFMIVLGPVLLGMLLNAWRPKFAAVMSKPVKLLSVVVLLAVIGVALFKGRGAIGSYFAVLAPACLAFNLLSLAVGYGVPRLLKLNERQSIAIGMEIGIHNGTLAIAIALSPLMLNNSDMAMPAVVYSGFMFFTAAAFGFWVNRKGRVGSAIVSNS